MPKPIIPSWLEKIFLWFYSLVIPIIKPNDQLARRLASFAKRALKDSKKQEELIIGFKTAKEIKQLAFEANNYEVLEQKPNLIVYNKQRSVIYILRERNEEELKQIVQKSLIAFD